MREIKFRAWDKENKKMMKVSSLSLENKEIAVRENGTYHFFRMKNLELMQYTGLNDKNDKEIYEGDILFFRDENTKYVVVWQDAAFIIKSIEIRKYSEEMCWLDDTEICCEIVGNIYENKNLLEENK
jgi:hypothetical protein